MTAPTIDTLHAAYHSGDLTPALLVKQLLNRCDSADPAIWITRLDREQLQVYLDALEGHSPDSKPLYGIPFAIKDNIDLAGLPTTAACPDFSYVPDASAPVVQSLIDAGAIPIGKTNLDQFATGLVGTRSPYGVPANAIIPGDIPGGSSSGSAVATALGLVTFALGTDTAGSGRVPASFNNIVGFKPSRGLLSTLGVVPACKSLDCISIFALTTGDAIKVFDLTRVFEAEDAWSRPFVPTAPGWQQGMPFRFGVLPISQRFYFGAPEADALYDESVSRLCAMGGTAVGVDFSAFFEAARLLYEGPWVAERYVATAAQMEKNAGAFLPVTRRIIEGGIKPLATDAFRAIYRLAELRRASESLWSQVDVMLTPTAPRCYTIEEVTADPVSLNTNLGTYTNFMNLLDLCGCAVPAGFLPNGRAWGVTLMAPAFQDERVLALAQALHELSGVTLGASGAALSKPSVLSTQTSGWMQIAVCGAHMQGLQLNQVILAHGARFNRRSKTAPFYRMYHLPGSGTCPPRPGLVRIPAGGVSIEIEVWDLPESALGSFFDTIEPPLGLGWVELENGNNVCGFICEANAISPSCDISEYGGWRAWLRAQSGSPSLGHASIDAAAVHIQ